MALTPSTLTDVIEVLRKRIQQIRQGKKIIGEQNTKATLIDPLLKALGWDPEKLDDVEREYRRTSEDNPVDYALFLKGTPRLFIEAKSLDKNLGEHKWITQNLTYATAAGVQWCVLTNGDEYQIYNAHAPVAVEEKLFRRVRISEDDPEYLAKTLILLSKEKIGTSLLEEMWKAHFIDARVRQALERLFLRQDPKLISAIRKRTADLSVADISSSLQRAEIRIDFREPIIPPRPTKVTLRILIAAGLIQPPLAVERHYKGVRLVAVIQQDGKIEFGGEAYDSVSTAGRVAKKSVIHRDVSTHGWRFWRYRDSSGKLREIDFFRKQYLKKRSAVTEA